MDKKQKVYLMWVVLFLVLLFFQKISLARFSNINVGILFFLEILFLVYYFINRVDFVSEQQTSKSWKIFISVFLFVFVAIIFTVRIKKLYIDKTALYYPTLSEAVKWLCIFLVAGFAEEALIKKLLYEKLLIPVMHKWVAVCICSFVFTLMHFEPKLLCFMSFMLYQAITLLFYQKWDNVYVYGLYLALSSYAIYL